MDAQYSMTTLQISNALNLAILAAALAIMLLALAKKRIELHIAIAPIVWLAHGVLFYIIVMARVNHAPTVFFSLWSSALRLQAGFTLLASAVIGLWKNGNSH